MSRLITIQGDLIELAKQGRFDVIGHGCNCFCRMKRGIAPKMVEAFGVNDTILYDLEHPVMEGDHNKLGQIQGIEYDLNDGEYDVMVYNMYTQYHWKEPAQGDTIPLDYEALAMCLKKLAYLHPRDVIGLPKIGCGLAGGSWEQVRTMINFHLAPFVKKVIVVEYEGDD